MGNNGAIRLADYSWSVIEVGCDKCRRRGRLSKARLLGKYGDVAMPDLLREIAADCPRIDNFYYDQCGVYYPALVRAKG